MVFLAEWLLKHKINGANLGETGHSRPHTHFQSLHFSDTQTPGCSNRGHSSEARHAQFAIAVTRSTLRNHTYINSPASLRRLRCLQRVLRCSGGAVKFMG